MNFVKLGGKKRPIHYGYNALRVFCNTTGRSLETLGTEMTLDDTINLIYSGLEDGARIQKEQFECDIVTLCDWLDADPLAMGEALKYWAESLPNLFPPQPGSPRQRGQA